MSRKSDSHIEHQGHDFNAGAVRLGVRVRPILVLILLPTILLAAGWNGSARAQGSIFGVVQNSNGTSPAVGELSWWGFLDDTDEEIRIESNIGAGYDGLNWYDDFQNYTTEAAGNPYDYYFSNPANGESFHLAGLIPDNSFQQEDVVLVSAPLPARPQNLTAAAISSTEIVLHWSFVPGLAFRIYRRNSSNNGVFRRLDDPSGTLSSAGVADSSFVDGTSDGMTRYTYVIIGEDGSGNFSPHSDDISVDAAMWCDCGVWGDLNGDGSVNAVDVVYIVNYVYKNQDARVQPPNCPVEAGNVDCDGIINPVEVVYYVNFVYKNYPNPFCPDPCIQ
jgi:hypothetical protein